MSRISSKKYLAGSRGQCTVDGCTTPGRIKKGLCPTHYQRMRKNGKLEAKPRKSPARDYFLASSLSQITDACIPWPFHRKSNGYAVFNQKVASRLMCEAKHGKPPTKYHQAAHSCGKGHEGCINPNHLSWKTPLENKADELIHGTRNRGERNGQSKLSSEDVRWIRFHAGRHSTDYMAYKLSVHKRTITDVIKGSTWSWVP